MKASYLNASRILLCFVIVPSCILTGCKKEAPPPQEPAAQTASTQDQPAEEKEFLSAPDVVICKLEKTTISKLDLPQNNMASFIRRMQRDNREDVKQAQITLANRPCRIILGNKLEREFYLYDTETGIGPYWWGSWSLHSYHKIDDKFYEFKLIEDGTKIAARPYKGPLGTIMVGKGGRELEKVEFKGAVRQKANMAAPIGIIEDRSPKAVTECTIPVGDYTSYIMHVTYDNLDICISNNYHTNAQGQSGGKDTVYGMQVRQDKPYVLDFSNEPMVIFDRPSKSKTSFLSSKN